jgi:hypothetical protein
MSGASDEAEMDDPTKSGGGRERRLIFAAIVALLVIGGIAYEYSDDLMQFAQSFTGGKLGHAQGRIHY